MIYVVHPKLLDRCLGDVRISHLPGVLYPEDINFILIFCSHAVVKIN